MGERGVTESNDGCDGYPFCHQTGCCPIIHRQPVCSLRDHEHPFQRDQHHPRDFFPCWCVYPDAREVPRERVPRPLLQRVDGVWVVRDTVWGGRGIRMCISPKRRPAKWKAKRGRPVVARKDDYRLRFTVERSFAWLGNFRRLLIRWERHFSVNRSFYTFAVLLVCLRRACTWAECAAG